MAAKLNLTEILGFWRSYVIYLANPWKKPKLKKFYRQFVDPGDLCFDIGAHMGIQSQIWSQLDAKVVAVEPNPKLFNFLSRRFRRNQKITLVQEAIAAEEKVTSMYISSLAPTVSTLADEDWRNVINEKSSFDVKWDKEISVKTITLDGLIQKFGLPKFIKLDIEDFEWQALQGLTYKPSYISFEFFSYLPDRVIKCVKEIEKNGRYEYNFSIAEQFQLQMDRWISADELMNWINQRSQNHPQGDIYARLQTSIATSRH